mmetsp:Transcript_18042/g.22186  ORF Transcript_18042/g.22186 Transcript_18042/m.22186 type:complete len:224 (+) Transcript_18042:559-1230(+)
MYYLFWLGFLLAFSFLHFETIFALTMFWFLHTTFLRHRILRTGKCGAIITCSFLHFKTSQTLTMSKFFYTAFLRHRIFRTGEGNTIFTITLPHLKAIDAFAIAFAAFHTACFIHRIFGTCITAYTIAFLHVIPMFTHTLAIVHLEATSTRTLMNTRNTNIKRRRIQGTTKPARSLQQFIFRSFLKFKRLSVNRDDVIVIFKHASIAPEVEFTLGSRTSRVAVF